MVLAVLHCCRAKLHYLLAHGELQAQLLLHSSHGRARLVLAQDFAGLEMPIGPLWPAEGCAEGWQGPGASTTAGIGKHWTPGRHCVHGLVLAGLPARYNQTPLKDIIV